MIIKKRRVSSSKLIKNIEALPIQYDDFILLDSGEDGNKKKNNFLEQEKKDLQAKLDSESDQFFLPVDEFKDRSGRTVLNTNMPYETLDVFT